MTDKEVGKRARLRETREEIMKTDFGMLHVKNEMTRNCNKW